MLDLKSTILRQVEICITKRNTSFFPLRTADKVDVPNYFYCTSPFYKKLKKPQSRVNSWQVINLVKFLFSFLFFKPLNFYIFLASNYLVTFLFNFPFSILKKTT